MENIIIVDPSDRLAVHSEWLQRLPSQLSNCFELPDSNLEPRRITGLTYQQNEVFVQTIRDNDPDNLNLCLYMAINNEGYIWPYFELKVNRNPMCWLFPSPNPYITSTHFSSTKGTYEGYLGVSANYKNEVCINWALLPYYKVESVFFTKSKFDVLSRTPQLICQNRVRKFIIPGADMKAMQRVFSSKNQVRSISVHFGMSKSKIAMNEIPFDPIIEIKMAGFDQGQNQLVEDGDDPGDSTFLDFVHACPPTCPD